MVDQDPAHGLRRDPEEVRAALPSNRPLIDELEKGLVDEGGGLQRVIDPLASHVACGQPPQLGVDDRKQLIARFVAPVAPLLKQLRHFRT